MRELAPGGSRAAARGAGAGALATAAMSGFMLAAQRLGALGKAPPLKVTERLLLGVARRWPHRRRRRALATVNHFLFGAAAGALFAFAARGLARRGRVAAGTAYGAAIWGATYGAALPALGLMPSARRDRPGRPLAMAAAHLVFGSALGALA